MYDCTYTLTPDKDYGFIIGVTEIPGLLTDGKTPEEALANVQDAIRGAIELKASLGEPLDIREVQPAAVRPKVAAAG